MKKKGFGKSQPSIKEAKKFILAFRDCVIKNKGDKAKLEQFLESNLERLDKSFLEALPLLFNNLIANKSSNKRERNAKIFANFGYFIVDFPRGDIQLPGLYNILDRPKGRKMSL